MVNLKKMVQWQTTSGDRLTVGEITVTPQSRALTIGMPYGSWVWNRPVALQVDGGNAPGAGPARIPIVDVTRLAQLGLLGLSMIFSIITLFLLIQQRRA